MYKTRKQIYLYQGYALAVGGYIDRDGDRIAIEGVAPAVLSIVGGSSHGAKQSYSLPERRMFSFGRKNDFYFRVKSARSEVVGREHAGGYMTRSRTWLEGFDLSGMVTADAIASDLLSEHDVPNDLGEGRISLGESTISGLKINGVSVKTTPDPVFNDYRTFAELRKHFDTGRAKSMRAISLMEKLDEEPPYVADLRRCVRDDIIRCSMYSEITPAKSSLRQFGYSFDLPEFGRIFLGELLVSKGVKRLNMIRFDLGCDPGGAGSGGFSVVDGETMP